MRLLCIENIAAFGPIAGLGDGQAPIRVDQYWRSTSSVTDNEGCVGSRRCPLEPVDAVLRNLKADNSATKGNRNRANACPAEHFLAPWYHQGERADRRLVNELQF